MKKLLALLLAMVMVVGLVACGETPVVPDETEGQDQNQTEGNQLEGTYDITMWVSEMDGVAEMTQEMIDAFELAYPGVVINA